MSLVLLALAASIEAHAELQPLYAVYGNRTFTMRVRLESKTLGYLKPGEAVDIRLHAEANDNPLYYAYAPAAVSTGPVRVAIEFSTKPDLTGYDIDAYLRVYIHGAKVHEEHLDHIGWFPGAKKKYDVDVVFEYHMDGRLVVTVNGEWEHTVSVDGSPLQIVGEAKGAGDCHSEVRIEKKWKVASPPPVEPGSGAEGKPDIPDIRIGDIGGPGKTLENLRPVIDKALIAMIGVAALFAIPLIIIAVKRAAVAAVLIPLLLAPLLAQHATAMSVVAKIVGYIGPNHGALLHLHADGRSGMFCGAAVYAVFRAAIEPDTKKGVAYFRIYSGITPIYEKKLGPLRGEHDAYVIFVLKGGSRLIVIADGRIIATTVVGSPGGGPATIFFKAKYIPGCSQVKVVREWKVTPSRLLPSDLYNTQTPGRHQQPRSDGSHASDYSRASREIDAWLVIGAVLLAIPLIIIAGKRAAALLLLALLLAHHAAAASVVALEYGRSHYTVHPGQRLVFYTAVYAEAADGYFSRFLTSAATVEAGGVRVTVGWSTDTLDSVVELLLLAIYPDGSTRTILDEKFPVHGVFEKRVRVEIDYCSGRPALLVYGKRVELPPGHNVEVTLSWSSSEASGLVLDPQLRLTACSPHSVEGGAATGQSVILQRDKLMMAAAAVAALLSIPLWVYALRK